MAIIQNPKQFKIPTWFLNRQKDYKTGKYSQAFANTLHTTLRSDLERLKKIRAHRGLRHYWCIRVRGQHTKSTGRRGKTMAATKKECDTVVRKTTTPKKTKDTQKHKKRKCLPRGPAGSLTGRSVVASEGGQ